MQAWQLNAGQLSFGPYLYFCDSTGSGTDDPISEALRALQEPWHSGHWRETRILACVRLRGMDVAGFSTKFIARCV